MSARDEAEQLERWERRARKLAKRREGMQVAGAGLKKVLLPLLRKRAEEVEPKAPKARMKRKKR